MSTVFDILKLLVLFGIIAYPPFYDASIYIYNMKL